MKLSSLNLNALAQARNNKTIPLPLRELSDAIIYIKSQINQLKKEMEEAIVQDDDAGTAFSLLRHRFKAVTQTQVSVARSIKRSGKILQACSPILTRVEKNIRYMWKLLDSYSVKMDRLFLGHQNETVKNGRMQKIAAEVRAKVPSFVSPSVKALLV